MSLKYSTTTADYLRWDEMSNLVRRLSRDGDYKMSLLIAIGCFWGLRISDILSLRWKDILNVDEFTLQEKKTKKNRTIRINPQLKRHIAELALVKLMELFNHSSVAITKRYLGLRQEEILQTYDSLSF